MVAARDPLLQFLSEEAAAGKAIIGNCNGAQILVESGLIPLDRGLRMSLARNVAEGTAAGFLNEWIWIKPTCEKDRCVTSDWNGTMHIPLAHGEGRFTTKDKDVIDELRKNDQIAFSYCDEQGTVSADPIVTPNGSMFAIAGICNPSGNVVALMPHPERTSNGDSYFRSMKGWIESKKQPKDHQSPEKPYEWNVPIRKKWDTEIFIDTVIVNNEERTVEQALKNVFPSVRLKQLRYIALSQQKSEDFLTDISHFNPNKEIAYVRMGSEFFKWNHEERSLEKMANGVLTGPSMLRRDEPDTGAAAIGKGSETGICYVCTEIDEQKLYSNEALEILCNPHASTLEKLSA